MKRRELFSSLVSSFKKDEKQEKIIRPPYFKDEDIFFTNCKDCEGLCATVCEENIIFIQEDCTPNLILHQVDVLIVINVQKFAPMKF